MYYFLHAFNIYVFKCTKTGCIKSTNKWWNDSLFAHVYWFFSIYTWFFGWNKKFFARRIDKNQGMLPSKKMIKQTVEDTFPFKEKLLKENIEYN